MYGLRNYKSTPMDFWNNKVNVSEAAARMQISITSKFSSAKKSKIASDFLSFGIDGTRKWIKRKYPYFSELQVNLEFVRSQYYEQGTMTEEQWVFYERVMRVKINKDWSARFKKMMKAQD